MNATDYTRLIDCAAGRIPADTLLTNCRVACVFTGEIRRTDVAIIGDRIAGLGTLDAARTIDLEGRYLCPGFIDGHIHIESSMLTPDQFAAAVLPHGTTTVICDPHEIANVCGMTGIDFMLAGNPLITIHAMASSCVPATHLETSGAELDSDDIARLLDRADILGLAEMMNFPGTVAALPEVLSKILIVRQRGLPIDGHAPGLSGRELQAYVAAGIGSDHECTSLAEAEEKLGLGMWIFIREGSTARNLEALLPLINGRGAHRCLLVTDDRHADDLIDEGHLDYILRRAVQMGAEPLTALQMVTLNPARYFGLPYTGAVAPGYRADLAVVDDLHEFTVDRVFRNGICTAHRGALETPVPPPVLENIDPRIRSSVNIDPAVLDFTIAAGSGPIRVITCTDGEIVTGSDLVEPRVENGSLVADPARDILKIAVIERHRGTMATGLGFVQGLGIDNGAVASTVAHDSHNLIVVGSSDAAILQAVRAVIDMQGGIAVAQDDRVLATLALPVAGLMAAVPAKDVRLGLQELKRAVTAIGSAVENPFMLLSFLALPVIPELKITDRGLVDVTAFEIVPLLTDKKEKNPSKD
jgi:adenine deaminase